MAKRRAFSKEVVETDWFTDLNARAQCLYFHLAMNTDNDGFVTNIKMSLANSHASESDLKALLDRNFVIEVEEGLYLIKHHLQNNVLKYTNDSPFADRLSKFSVKEDGSYTARSKNLPCALRTAGKKGAGSRREETIEEEVKRKGSGSEEEETSSINLNQKINAQAHDNGYLDNNSTDKEPSPEEAERLKREIEIIKTPWIKEEEE